jgi:hypothetical protein
MAMPQPHETILHRILVDAIVPVDLDIKNFGQTASDIFGYDSCSNEDHRYDELWEEIEDYADGERAGDGVEVIGLRDHGDQAEDDADSEKDETEEDGLQ